MDGPEHSGWYAGRTGRPASDCQERDAAARATWLAAWERGHAEYEAGREVYAAQLRAFGGRAA